MHAGLGYFGLLRKHASRYHREPREQWGGEEFQSRLLTLFALAALHGRRFFVGLKIDAVQFCVADLLFSKHQDIGIVGGIECLANAAMAIGSHYGCGVYAEASVSTFALALK